ncbi:hypothetical protein CENSYa_0309 [Cenarchaeum symbiosum A]|uniref:Uncharacterized protein n=1 Tax=Cenarchaeum symbiosum (strain A) TaxID=414004 RepID=A0RUC9_CENSY|nr:hypothetical protein CENSYa_0309 [Cenarchaeum symbiosum A]
MFRRSIITGYFEPQLLGLDFLRSDVRHPSITDGGLMQSGLLHVFFDVDTGADYPDGDEWVIVEYLLPLDASLPDSLKGTDHFTTISAGSKTYWHHRELVRFKYGKSKKLSESLVFIESKYKELHGMLEPLELS